MLKFLNLEFLSLSFWNMRLSADGRVLIQNYWLLVVFISWESLHALIIPDMKENVKELTRSHWLFHFKLESSTHYESEEPCILGFLYWNTSKTSTAVKFFSCKTEQIIFECRFRFLSCFYFIEKGAVSNHFIMELKKGKNYRKEAFLCGVYVWPNFCCCRFVSVV